MKPRWTNMPPVVRRAILVVAIIVLWQIWVSAFHVPQLLFAAPSDVAHTLVTDIANGSLVGATVHTLEILIIGMAIGGALGILFAAFGVLSGVGHDLLRVLTSAFNPLPAIAVLPLAMLWFGLTPRSIVFVVALATVWPVALNTESGFRTISSTLRMVAQNLGLRGPRLVFDVLLPGALPQIITGAKTSWAFGWRTVVAAELVFGVAGASGGLGWYISNARYYLQTPAMFAGLVTISVLGLLVEALFNAVETRTVVRWGMSLAAETREETQAVAEEEAVGVLVAP
ncbi:MAG TPA: ABC transporter permease [Candidatus Acidoferrales bacterium]|nr:ABC transporter permease [Candidatus Acidoferrales bacterium]